LILRQGSAPVVTQVSVTDAKGDSLPDATVVSAPLLENITASTGTFRVIYAAVDSAGNTGMVPGQLVTVLADSSDKASTGINVKFDLSQGTAPSQDSSTSMLQGVLFVNQLANVAALQEALDTAMGPIFGFACGVDQTLRLQVCTFEGLFQQPDLVRFNLGNTDVLAVGSTVDRILGYVGAVETEDGLFAARRSCSGGPMQTEDGILTYECGERPTGESSPASALSPLSLLARVGGERQFQLRFRTRLSPLPTRTDMAARLLALGVPFSHLSRGNGVNFHRDEYQLRGRGSIGNFLDSIRSIGEEVVDTRATFVGLRGQLQLRNPTRAGCTLLLTRAGIAAQVTQVNASSSSTSYCEFQTTNDLFDYQVDLLAARNNATISNLELLQDSAVQNAEDLYEYTIAVNDAANAPVSLSDTVASVVTVYRDLNCSDDQLSCRLQVATTPLSNDTLVDLAALVDVNITMTNMSLASTVVGQVVAFFSDKLRIDASRLTIKSATSEQTAAQDPTLRRRRNVQDAAASSGSSSSSASQTISLVIDIAPPAAEQVNAPMYSALATVVDTSFTAANVSADLALMGVQLVWIQMFEQDGTTLVACMAYNTSSELVAALRQLTYLSDATSMGVTGTVLSSNEAANELMALAASGSELCMPVTASTGNLCFPAAVDKVVVPPPPSPAPKQDTKSSGSSAAMFAGAAGGGAALLLLVLLVLIVVLRRRRNDKAANSRRLENSFVNPLYDGAKLSHRPSRSSVNAGAYDDVPADTVTKINPMFTEAEYGPADDGEFSEPHFTSNDTGMDTYEANNNNNDASGYLQVSEEPTLGNAEQPIYDNEESAAASASTQPVYDNSESASHTTYSTHTPAAEYANSDDDDKGNEDKPDDSYTQVGAEQE
jgi:hypothetical protein